MTERETDPPAIRAERTSPKLHTYGILGLICWLIVCFSAASMGMLFPPGAWYANLDKPLWNPPSWLFAPVWTSLYILMALSAWLVWLRGGFAEQRRPLLLFLTQIVMNALWTPVFFGLQKPLIALVVIVTLWIAIAATMFAFNKVQRFPALMLIPYLIWVTFASALNFELWRLNR